jgi:uncharacterized membrane protein
LFSVIFGSVAATEPALARLRLDERRKRQLLAPTTALLATSLDLVMDCFGLDQGLWEWNLDGPYAAEIEGTNGRKGIPLLNFFGWIFLVAVVMLLCQSLTRTEEAENAQQPPRQPGIEQLSVVMLFPYYLVSAIWATKKRKLRCLLYSVMFPGTLVATFGRR